MVIRRGVAADISAVLDFWEAHEGPAGDAKSNRPALETLLDTDLGALLIAEDGELVGTVIVAFDGWRGAMYRLVTHTDRRRQGIARALVAAGEEQLRQQGARRVHLMVLSENDGGRSAWESFGYAHDAHDVRYVKML